MTRGFRLVASPAVETLTAGTFTMSTRRTGKGNGSGSRRTTTLWRSMLSTITRLADDIRSKGGYHGSAVRDPCSLNEESPGNLGQNSRSAPKGLERGH